MIARRSLLGLLGGGVVAGLLPSWARPAPKIPPAPRVALVPGLGTEFYIKHRIVPKWDGSQWAYQIPDEEIAPRSPHRPSTSLFEHVRDHIEVPD